MVQARGGGGASAGRYAATCASTNGGLDANWMVRHGIPTVTFGAGQNEIHTVEEWSTCPSSSRLPPRRRPRHAHGVAAPTGLTRVECPRTTAPQLTVQCACALLEESRVQEIAAADKRDFLLQLPAVVLVAGHAFDLGSLRGEDRRLLLWPQLASAADHGIERRPLDMTRHRTSIRCGHGEVDAVFVDCVCPGSTG